jgi:hypothetical protein
VIIKGELQKLAELILVSSQPKLEARPADRPEPTVKRAGGAELRPGRPVPWQESPRVAAIAQTAPPPPPESLQQTEEIEAGQALAPANAALAAVLSALPDTVLKPSANGNSQAGDGSASPRSRLLREAVPQKQVEAGSLKNGTASSETEPAAESANPETTRLQSQPESVNGPAPAQAQGEAENQTLEADSAKPSLLERLRGAGAENAEPGNS